MHLFDSMLARLVFVAMILCSSSLSATGSDKNGPELPVAPQAREGFEPGPSSPATDGIPDVEHTRQSGALVSEIGRGEVRFSDIALPNLPEFSGTPRSHLQGEYLDSGGIDLVRDGSFLGTFENRVEMSRPEPISEPTGATGDVVTNFSGISNTGWIPPDTVMAAGPTRIVEAVNSGFAVYTKTGSQLMGYTNFASFFAPVHPSGWSGFLFDPRVLFAPEHNKFVLLALGLDSVSQETYAYIAVSQSSDPTGGWWLWRFNTNFGGFTPDAWLDYAGLGADSWGIYLTGNYFLWTGGFKYSTIISLNPAMFSGGASNGWQFVDLRWPNTSLVFGPQPALPLTVAGGEETFFVNSFSGFGSQVLLWTLTGDRTSSPSLSGNAVSVSSYTAIGENIDQPGSTIDIDGGNARIMNAFYSQRRVYTTLTTDSNGDTSSSGALLAKLNVDSNAAEWSTVLDGGAGWFYFYPAVVVGDPSSTSPPVSVFLSYTNAVSAFASSAVRTYNGPPGDTSGVFPGIALGEAPYVALDNIGRNRWGDYSGAGYDFSTQNVWGAVEHAGSNNTWRTRIAQVEIGGSGGNNPPFVPSNPSPANNADFVTVSAVLGWSGGDPDGDTVTYDVFLEANDSSPDVLVCDDSPSTTCDPPGDLLPNTLYYWQVIARDSGLLTATGPVWSFITAPASCSDDIYETSGSGGSDDDCFGALLSSPQDHLHCDEDWIYFTGVVPGATYRIETFDLIGDADTTLALHLSCGPEVAFDDDGGTGLGSRIDWTATDTSLLDVRIRQFSDDYVEGEGYSINVTCIADCDGSAFIFGDGFESGNTSAWSVTVP